MNKVVTLVTALQHGYSLTKPEVYKNRQNLLNAVLGLFGAVTLFLPIPVSPDDVTSIAGGVAALVGVINVYVTTATTDKIGIKARDSPEGDNLS